MTKKPKKAKKTEKPVMWYRFVSDYAYITFSVPGESGWEEDEWDSAAQDDLESYVTSPEDYQQDDCWEEQ